MGSPALDLQDIDPRVWRVKAGETVYGPYTLGQMCQFVSEGRVAAHSLVADGVGAFIPAGETAALRGAFAALAPAEPAADTAPATPAEPLASPTNMLVVLKLAEQAGPLMQALSELGSFVEASPGTVLLRTTSRIAAVQRRLGEAVQAGDKVLIVDAGANRIAWLGYGPETGAALRELWNGR